MYTSDLFKTKNNGGLGGFDGPVMGENPHPRRHIIQKDPAGPRACFPTKGLRQHRCSPWSNNPPQYHEPWNPAECIHPTNVRPRLCRHVVVCGSFGREGDQTGDGGRNTVSDNRYHWFFRECNNLQHHRGNGRDVSHSEVNHNRFKEAHHPCGNCGKHQQKKRGEPTSERIANTRFITWMTTASSWRWVRQIAMTVRRVCSPNRMWEGIGTEVVVQMLLLGLSFISLLEILTIVDEIYLVGWDISSSLMFPVVQ